MARSGGRWLVEVHDNIDGLEAEWSALVGQHNATPFQSYGFMHLFMRQLLANGADAPVVALVRSQDGRPVALLVMLRSRQFGLRWLRTDARPIDFCSPVFDSSLAQDDLRDIVQAVLVAIPGVDLLYCNRMPERFEGGLNPFVRLSNAARLRLSAWKIELAGRSAQDLAAARPAKFRANLRRSTKNLAQAHRRDFSLAMGSEIDSADIAAFRDLRTTSTEEKGRKDILSQDEWSNIYLSLLNGEGGSCQGWLSKLEADGEPIAYLFGIRVGRCIVATLTASKLGPWKHYSPGLQLFSETIEHFRAAGYDCFDLSIGDMDYKRRFGCEEIPLHDALFPKTFAGRAYYLFWRLKVAVRARLKPLAEARASKDKGAKSA
jgi:CelD/BcsL family acetyltransferase involved in cellulose biosynthesis